MKVHRDIEQGAPEWLALRAGWVTASCFGDILAEGQGKTRAKYLRQIVAERLTGKTSESYRNHHMDRGIEQEPMARMAYEAVTDNVLDRVAFIEHDELRVGCSPDSLVFGRRRGVEVKCVLPDIQVQTIERGGHPPEHKAQIQGSMWITGYEEWDFVSYSPDMPTHLRTYIHTVKRDEPYIQALAVKVVTFLNEVDACITRLNASQQDVAALLKKSLVAA